MTKNSFCYSSILIISLQALRQPTARMRLKTCWAVLVMLRRAVSLFIASSSGIALSTIEKKASIPCRLHSTASAVVHPARAMTLAPYCLASFATPMGALPIATISFADTSFNGPAGFNRSQTIFQRINGYNDFHDTLSSMCELVRLISLCL